MYADTWRPLKQIRLARLRPAKGGQPHEGFSEFFFWTTIVIYCGHDEELLGSPQAVESNACCTKQNGAGDEIDNNLI